MTKSQQRTLDMLVEEQKPAIVRHHQSTYTDRLSVYFETKCGFGYNHYIGKRGAVYEDIF
jgi:hypothetical protein